jgi:hypothetical protein
MPEKRKHSQDKQIIPRGLSAGKQAYGDELLARTASRTAGWPFESLLAWRVYPDRVVLIAEDGRKIEIPVSAVESILLEEV